MSTPEVRQRYRRAYVVLALLSLAMGVLSMLFTVNYYHASQHNAQVRQAQQARLELIPLCTTLTQLAALQPPPNPSRSDPSRLYLARLHAQLAAIPPNLGCKKEIP